MISLDQVRLLESKVEKAITKITTLTAENSVLQKKVAELEQFIKLYEEDQMRIEEGIVNALNRLNGIETAITQSVTVETVAVSIHEKAEVISESVASSDSVAAVANEIFQQVAGEQQKPQHTESDPLAQQQSGQFDIF